MLKGYFSYKGHSYKLKGYDRCSSFAFYVYPDSKTGWRYFDKGIVDEEDNVLVPPVWNSVYMSVGLVDLKMSNQVDESEGSDGKVYKYKNKYTNLPVILGSILRGIKGKCNPKNICNDAKKLSKNSILQEYLSAENDDNVFESVSSYKFDLSIPNLIATDDVYSFECAMSMSAVKSLYVIKKGVEEESESDLVLYLYEDGENSIVEKNTSTQQKIKLCLNDFSEEILLESSNLDSNDILSFEEVCERFPERNYRWLLKRDYHIVNDKEEAKKVINEIKQWKGVVSFDTETSGLDFTFKSETGESDRLVGMVFTIREGQSWYFPIANKKFKNVCTPEEERDWIVSNFKDILEQKDIIGQNLGFDWKVMYTYGIDTNIVEDVMHMAINTFQAQEPNISVALKKVTKSLLHRDSLELEDLVVNSKFGDSVRFWDLPYETVRLYACADTDNVLALYNLYKKTSLLDKYEAKNVYRIETAFSKVIAYQEYYGHHVDVTKSELLSKQLYVDKERIKKEMIELAGEEFNPSSTKDLQYIFYEKLKYPILSRSAKGNPSTDKNTLNKLAKMKDKDDTLLYPLAGKLLEYRVVNQLISNFIESMSKYATKDGYIFSEVKQYLNTGRVSVKNTNYQSYNDTVKEYICPRPGYYMIDADYSSVEYRITVSMAHNKNLIEAFKDPDTDYHTLQASRMFNIPYENVTPKLRKQAKGINFGLPYGMGDTSLGARLFGEVSKENTKKAAEMRRKYFDGQEDIEVFFSKAQQEGVDNGYSKTLFGRRRYYKKGSEDIGSIRRESGNAKIQGTAADIYKLAMSRLLDEIRKRGWLGKVLISAFVHDECLLEISNEIDPAIMLNVLRKCMMVKIKDWCPLYTGAGYGRSWVEAKHVEIPVQVQNMICTEWGKTGVPWYHDEELRKQMFGDMDRNSCIAKWSTSLIEEYRYNRIVSYLKNEDNWGKVLHPVENSLVKDLLEDIKSELDYVNGKSDGKDLLLGVKEALDSGYSWFILPQLVHKDLVLYDGVVDRLREFCRVFDCMDLFDKANIIEKSETKEAEVNTHDLSNIESDFEDYQEDDDDVLDDLMLNRMGCYIDQENKIIYIKDYGDNQNCKLEVCKFFRGIVDEKGSYKVILKGKDMYYITEKDLFLSDNEDEIKIDIPVNSPIMVALRTIYLRNHVIY